MFVMETFIIVELCGKELPDSFLEMRTRINSAEFQ